MPSKMKIALFLLHQFEAKEFDFDIIKDEEKLQEIYEEMEKSELVRVAAEAGKLAVKVINAKDKKHKEKLAKKAAVPQKASKPVVHEEILPK